MNRKEIHGVYSDAVIYTVDNPGIAVDGYALAQIQMICDHRTMSGTIIRVMPDVHPGKVGPIGLTMVLGQYVMPQLVGIDIGCGMSMVRLNRPKLEYQKLDGVIREAVPSGFRIHGKSLVDFDFGEMVCTRHIHQDRALCSLGTLGGGNHFIEIDHGEDGEIYMIVHSGSRHLGKEVCEYYCREGQLWIRDQGISEPYETTWLEGHLRQDYLHDMEIVQRFAQCNRETIIRRILKGMKWKMADEVVSCCHNYIEDTGDVRILRKGAISAKSGESAIIPINMRDGVILGRGKGNREWNCSAPHGAGRLYKREEVQNLFSVSAYKKSMAGIYSSCIGRGTLDESPFCYRSLTDIQSAITETVEIEHVLKPLYNYKDNTEFIKC